MNRTLTQAAAAYLDGRYRHGFIPTNTDNHVSSFARFSADCGQTWPMTADLCLQWAREGTTHADPFTWARRLEALRPFSRCSSAFRRAGNIFSKAAIFRDPLVVCVELQR